MLAKSRKLAKNKIENDMKRVVVLMVALCFAVALPAQELARAGVCDAGEIKTFAGNPRSVVAVELRVEQQQFTPGVYARYAQKYLGVRASLASRTDTRIVLASLSAIDSVPLAITAEPASEIAAESAVLPSNRLNNAALSPEQQAAATADLIFSLRKHRVDLITGETGENVFGAGLRAALDEIERLEKEYLAMFYGTTVTTQHVERFTITPSRDKVDYLLCRYRAGEGIVSIADLAGEAVMLHIAPAEKIDLSGLPIADEKAKTKSEYIVANPSQCTLLCGTNELVKITLPLFQYGSRVHLTPSQR